MANTNPPSAAEIIFNRANIALARSQRLVASWLPPQPSETSNSRRTENQKNDNDNAGDDDDDDENFTAVPERYVLLSLYMLFVIQCSASTIDCRRLKAMTD